MEKRYCKRCNATTGLATFGGQNEPNFCVFFVVVLVVTVSEAPAHTKYFDKCYEEHKDDRKDYRKAYNQIEIECEVCKCTLENAIWQNTF